MTLQPSPAPAAPVPSGPSARPRPLPLWLSVLLGLLSGAAMLVSTPPYRLWWLAPIAVALLAAAAHRRRLRGGLGVGLLAGLVFFVPLLDWTRIAAGIAPWALLSVASAGFVAVFGAACAWMSPVVDRWRGVWPLLTGLLWTAMEAARDRVPFGGFPWGRLAFSQAGAPDLRIAVLGGAPAVTFVVAATGGLLVALVWRRRFHWPVVAYVVAGALLVLGPALIPAAQPHGPLRTIAIVQGNVPRLGLDFNSQRRAVLDNHASATFKLAAAVKAGTQKKPDLVIWPENSSDIDPLRNQDAAQEIAAAAAAIEAPILVGAVLQGDKPGEIKNAGILWQPVTGPDLAQMYVKRHPVPFAEYMPLRPVARLVSDKVDLVQNMVAGDHPGVVHTGPATLGDVICFEVAYDGIVRDTVTGGGQLLTVQTNNATFNDAEARQQLAMVQERAVEHGRNALMVSTVGVSAFADPAGTIHGATEFNTPAVVVRELRIGGPRTLATRLGRWPETAATALAVVALAGALPLRRRRKRAAPTTHAEER